MLIKQRTGEYKIFKIIFGTLILLACSSQTFSYTFNEDVLERCGQKHPNDFAGRVVCNNRMQTEICLEKEQGKVDEKIKEIENIIQPQSTISLETASTLINNLKDIKGNNFRSTVITRTDKE